MTDHFGREVNYLRISVTDRCNLRCQYCMPDGIEKVPMHRILTYEQMAEIAAAAVSLGMTRFKVTGGEPLVRLGCASFIKTLYAIPGTEEVTLTTNGVLLKDALPELSEAGLRSVNVSLDTLNAAVYAAITGTDALKDVLLGIDAALSLGMRVKVNAVLIQGVNEDQFLPLAALAKDNPLDVRFIELMPVGYGRKFQGLNHEILLRRLAESYGEVTPDESRHGNGPAVYYHVPGFRGSVGFISALHGKFCGSCNRLRLTSMGKLQHCLCYDGGTDVADVFLTKDTDARFALLQERIKSAVLAKPEGHVFEDVSRVNAKPLSEVGG